MSEGPSRAFGIRSCRDMLDKLQWEIVQLAVADGQNDFPAIQYGTINGALTAWHVCDWVESTLKRRHEDDPTAGAWDEFRSVSGQSAGNLGALQDYVRANSPAVSICEQIAIGAKHVTATKEKPVRRGVSIIADAEHHAFFMGHAAMGEGPLGFFSRILIVDGAKRYSPHQLLTEAKEWWSMLLPRIGIR